MTNSQNSMKPFSNSIMTSFKRDLEMHQWAMFHNTYKVKSTSVQGSGQEWKLILSHPLRLVFSLIDYLMCCDCCKNFSYWMHISTIPRKDCVWWQFPSASCFKMTISASDNRGRFWDLDRDMKSNICSSLEYFTLLTFVDFTMLFVSKVVLCLWRWAPDITRVRF